MGRTDEVGKGDIMRVETFMSPLMNACRMRTAFRKLPALGNLKELPFSNGSRARCLR